jgi:hypothetical protein|tara:strand:- start:1002 stop:1340 length:339 start_codon:yes stop_codon:yes gene_type:complete
MENLVKLVQITLAISVAYVWVFRFHNVIKEFKQFGLSDLTRNLIGAIKISLATLLVAGIWNSTLVLIPSILMGLLMVGAQYFHFKIKNPFIKHLPSLILLGLCVFIILISIQ